MEDISLIRGEIILDQICVSDNNMIKELEQKGYGEIEKEILFLKQFETLYLLYSKRLVLNKGKREIDFDNYMNICKKTESEVLTKFLIYRDLRNRGYIVKDGFGFGSDFRVYERGHFGEKGAKFLIFGLNEGQQEKMGNLQKKIEEITQMGKEPIIAVVDRRGEVIYYKINKIHFYENNSKLEKQFHL
ncbi:MAG: tRNA-intron lyase [Nitrosopumilus sp.]